MDILERIRKRDGVKGKGDVERKNEGEEIEFSDTLDAMKHVMLVHIDDALIGNDLVLFRSEDKDIEFIKNQMKLVENVDYFVEDKGLARRLKEKMLREVYLIAVLKRNREGNLILKGILERGAEVGRLESESKLAELLSPNAEVKEEKNI